MGLCKRAKQTEYLKFSSMQHLTIRYGECESRIRPDIYHYAVYRLPCADVKIDGVSVGAVTSYTFTNVTAVHTIEATFAPNSMPWIPLLLLDD
jgi:hypothetical protein